MLNRPRNFGIDRPGRPGKMRQEVPWEPETACICKEKKGLHEDYNCREVFQLTCTQNLDHACTSSQSTTEGNECLLEVWQESRAVFIGDYDCRSLESGTPQVLVKSKQMPATQERDHSHPMTGLRLTNLLAIPAKSVARDVLRLKQRTLTDHSVNVVGRKQI